MTHCDIIESLAGFTSLKIQLVRRFVNFINKSRSGFNTTLSMICNLAIVNPMSSAGINYINICQTYGNILTSHMIQSYHVDPAQLSLLNEAIEIRDGIMNCDNFTR